MVYTLYDGDPEGSGTAIGIFRLNATNDALVFEHVPSGETITINSGGIQEAADDPHGNEAHTEDYATADDVGVSDHGNEEHTETFAVDGDAQPPEEHDNAAHSENYLVEGDASVGEHGNEEHDPDFAESGHDHTADDLNLDLSDVDQLGVNQLEVGEFQGASGLPARRQEVSNVDSGDNTTTINVPQDYSTVQEAIEAAHAYKLRHDIDIDIDGGYYPEDIVIPRYVSDDISSASEGNNAYLKIVSRDNDPFEVDSVYISNISGMQAVSFVNMKVRDISPYPDESAAICGFGGGGGVCHFYNTYFGDVIGNSGNSNADAFLAYGPKFKLQADIELGDGNVRDAFQVKGMGQIDVHGYDNFSGHVNRSLCNLKLPGIMFINGDGSVTTGSSLTWGEQAIAIIDSHIYGAGRVFGNNSDGGSATSYGVDCTANASEATAIGEDSRAVEGKTTALGQTAEAEGFGATALGRNARATATGAICIGSDAEIAEPEVCRVSVDQMVYGATDGTLPDGSIQNGEMTIAADENNNQFVLKYRNSSGTLQEGTVSW